MSEQQHTVLLGNGSVIRFSTPARAEQYAQAKRASDWADLWLSLCAYGAIAVAIVGLVWGMLR